MDLTPFKVGDVPSVYVIPDYLSEAEEQEINTQVMFTAGKMVT